MSDPRATSVEYDEGDVVRIKSTGAVGEVEEVRLDWMFDRTGSQGWFEPRYKVGPLYLRGADLEAAP